MGSARDELVYKYEISQHIELLRTLQQELDYNSIALSKSHLPDEDEEQVLSLDRFLQNTTSLGSSVVQIGKGVNNLRGHASNPSLARGFYFGGLALSIVDFFRVPLIYLIAYLLNRKIPVHLNINAQWLYSGVLLGLTILALAMPATAPVLGFVGAGIVLAVSTWMLVQTLEERYQLGREYRRIKKAIESEQQEMLMIQSTASRLEALLVEPIDEDQVIEILQQVALLSDRHKVEVDTLVELKKKLVDIKQKIKALGALQVLDKTMSLALACFSVIGLVASLFFPPIGLGILSGVAIVSGLYLLVRITAPLFQDAGLWIESQFKPTLDRAAQYHRLTTVNKLSDTYLETMGLTDPIPQNDRGNSIALEVDDSVDTHRSGMRFFRQAESTPQNPVVGNINPPVNESRFFQGATPAPILSEGLPKANRAFA